MASRDFSLSDLFEQAFGYRSEAFKPKFDKVTGYGGEIGDQAERALHKNFYGVAPDGREYYLPVAVTYPSRSGKNETLQLPFPVVAITTKKTIIETALTERTGTVKELVNVEDYEITIKGIIINKTNIYPEDDVKKLRVLYEINKPVLMRSVITDIFLLTQPRTGYDSVVIKELKMPEVRGVNNVWAYELVCLSDAPFSLSSIGFDSNMS